MQSIISKFSWTATFRYVFGISVFIYVVSRVDFSALNFKEVDWSLAAFSIIPLLAFIVSQGIRFNNLLATPLDARIVISLQAKMQFFNLVLPSGIGGDAYRIILLRGSGETLRSLISKSVVDRASGLILITGMFIVGTLQISGKIDNRNEILVMAIGLGTLFAAGIGLVLSRYWNGKALLKKSLSLLTYSFFCWLFQVARFWLLCSSVGLDMPVLGLAFILGIVQFSSLLPISVGGLGVIEGAFVLSSSVLGVPSSLSALIALLMRLTTIVSALPGLAIWLHEKNSR